MLSWPKTIDARAALALLCSLGALISAFAPASEGCALCLAGAHIIRQCRHRRARKLSLMTFASDFRRFARVARAKTHQDLAMVVAANCNVGG